MLARYMAQLKRQGAVRRYAIDPQALRQFLGVALRGRGVPPMVREEQARLHGIPGVPEHLGPALSGGEGADAALAMLVDLMQERGGVVLGQRHPLQHLLEALHRTHRQVVNRGDDISNVFHPAMFRTPGRLAAVGQVYREGPNNASAAREVRDLVAHIRGDQDLHHAVQGGDLTRLWGLHRDLLHRPDIDAMTSLYDVLDRLNQHPAAEEDDGFYHLTTGARHYVGEGLHDLNRRLLGGTD